MITKVFANLAVLTVLLILALAFFAVPKGMFLLTLIGLVWAVHDSGRRDMRPADREKGVSKDMK